MKKLIACTIITLAVLSSGSAYALTCGTDKDCLDQCTQRFNILIPICL